MSDPTLLVLASLADGEKHGYAMMEDIQRFRQRAAGARHAYGPSHGWNSAAGSGRGLGRRRRPYRITGAGREYLQTELTSSTRVKDCHPRLKHA